MTLEQLRAEYGTRIHAIAQHWGANNVRVFGSVARGEARPDSDIDFVVDFEPGRSLFDLAGLWLDLEAELSRKVDVISSRGVKPRLQAEITRDAKAV